MTCMESAKLGKARRIDDAAGRYIEFCKSTFPNDLDLRGLKIVVDSAHGAGYHVAPNVFHELGRRDSRRWRHAERTQHQSRSRRHGARRLRRKVLETRADCGIALDGDGDRLVMVDAAGQSTTATNCSTSSPVIARACKMLPGVAGTLMSNLGFEHALGRLGIALGRAKVGDRYVLEMMQDKGWQFGGENSGHIICLDRHSTGDGIIAALQVLAALRSTNESLAEACADLQLYPQRLINVRMPAGFAWQADASIQPRACGEVALDGAGRVLLTTLRHRAVAARDGRGRGRRAGQCPG
jgi:phosphoglucosamine mutase